MTTGKVTKIVRSYGSTWGLVRPVNEPRDVFFNLTSLVDAADFATLQEGDPVQFEERPDRANGMHAFQMSRISSPAAESVPTVTG